MLGISAVFVCFSERESLYSYTAFLIMIDKVTCEGSLHHSACREDKYASRGKASQWPGRISKCKNASQTNEPRKLWQFFICFLFLIYICWCVCYTCSVLEKSRFRNRVKLVVFRLSPCSECSLCSFGNFPGVRRIKADVSELIVGSIAQEDRTDIEFWNVGFYTSDAG